MNMLKTLSIAAAIAVSSVSLAPAYAASTTTATTATSTMKPAVKTAAKAADPKRFKTEAEAAAACPTDTIVWVNLSSRIFHLKGTATYGKGKKGVYMCEADATAEKFKPTKKPEKMISAAPTAATTAKKS